MESQTIVEDQQLEATQPEVAAELIYGLNDRPPVGEAVFVALQHVLAAFVGIITPPLIISTTLGLSPTETSYIISMSLFVSGIATFLQVKRFGPVGSGLLSLQGTSFAFLGSIVGIGTAVVQAGGTPQAALARIFGVCFFGAFVQIIFSRFLHLAQKIISPIVSGTVVMIIGLSLIKAGIISMAGGTGSTKEWYVWQRAESRIIGIGTCCDCLLQCQQQSLFENGGDRNWFGSGLYYLNLFRIGRF